ncbi:MAG: ACT domain-containing protein [Firmicutes bacterium]|nr:ACT domain-containing protein [Bacillota bacterium]
MSKYYVVSSDILPEVLEKVIEARSLLQSGKAKRISVAVKEVGISRGTYYKYKDAVFAFNQDESKRKAIVSTIISSEKGSLSQVLNLLAGLQVNVLAINQTIPINGVHTLSLTLDVSEMEFSVQGMIDLINDLKVIERCELIAVE